MAFLFWGKNKKEITYKEQFSEPVVKQHKEGSEVCIVAQDAMTSEVIVADSLAEKISFNFSHANSAQQEAIQITDGPVLIIAGPGTGKTFTLVQRALYLIMGKGVKPEQILMATFTEKAAKELITRISNELAAHNIPVNLNDMYIGTFHSICLRIIKEHLEYTRIKKNFRLLDDFDQKYMIFQNIRQFQAIKDFSSVIQSKYAWDQANEICTYVNNLAEELVDINKLISSGNSSYIAMGNIVSAYQQLLEDRNYLDFSGIQTEAYWMMKQHKEILGEIQDKIQYLMIDEYQDTNYIQEQIVFLLAGEKKNICVVGDDDQGLYRFRGATIRNILEFPGKFPESVCKIIKLTVNYRSNSDIVNFYNQWMQTSDFDTKHSFVWGKFRHDKIIVPHEKTKLHSPTVIRITSEEEKENEAWLHMNLEFINKLRKSGKLKDLNQIAFLFKSVKNEKVTKLANYLEEHGINVYSPRSDMFFERYEIKLLIGCLLLCFSEFTYNIQDRNFNYVDESLCQYYEGCLELTEQFLETGVGESLAEMLGEICDYHSFMEKNTDYAFTGLAYRIFAHEPFASMLAADVTSGVVDLRPTRNLALMTSILSKYEYLHRVDVFSPGKIQKDVELFFNLYLKLLMRGGIAEYEDDSEYAPSGCVSFLTIHQSKGMEFPIVIVGSLGNSPRAQNDDLMNSIAAEYFQRPPFEPFDTIKYFDFWRLYYTAFSRAQNLLVLTANRTKHEPSLYFREIFNVLPNFTSEKFNLNEFDFAEVKDVNLKDTYSFTSHIAVYEECALQYKFFKELGFTPIRVGATIFGTVVHETIEDIHRAVLRHEESKITTENIREWLNLNYATISKAEHAYLGQAQIDVAYKQCVAYAEKQGGDWSRIREAEVDVSLVKSDYILTGKIDLIRGDNDTVEVLDFKSEKRPAATEEAAYFDRYKKQLQVYAHLVEEKTGQHVSKLTLYYTGEHEGQPMISFPYTREGATATVQEFDNIVHKIQRKDFTGRSHNEKTCSNCDIKYYCKK